MYNLSEAEKEIINERFKKCQQLNETEFQSQTMDDDKMCPLKFDGWSCWPETAAGTTANQSCPQIFNFDSNRLVYHECTLNGSWIFKIDFNKSWVNYTTCLNEEDYNFRQQINLIYSIGYGLSLVALLVSLALFAYFKTLRCARITVHMNLFLSFAINNTLWLFWYNLVVNDKTILTNNELWCRVLNITLYSFLISNYSWMLCEGIYLHTILVSAFISERLLLRYMVVVGWGTPLLTAVIYVPIRTFFGEPDDCRSCWMEEGRFFFILLVPVVITVVLNVLFLINIVHVLLVKLMANGGTSGSSGASNTSLQALRATLLLVPLLGLNFLLTPFRPPKYDLWEHFYEVLSALTASLQGLCVATLFCFCNGEVITQVKRKWRALMFRPRSNSCTNTTVSFVRSSYPANGEEKV